ncbi:MAG TPA: MtrB/PioB family outer membrane beta-barrel protein [Vicinamibacterales bacterium]|nr:MtrB/PioB family outer membrane beta-barrel protein [Vicinamibacterales bacterium]
MKNAIVLLVLCASPVFAQEPAEPQNAAEVGVQGTSLSDGADPFQFYRYRDLRNGGTLDLLRYTKDNGTYWFNVQGDHIGYRDTRASASINDFGKLKASFEFNQIPYYFSNQTKTLFAPEGGVSENILRLPDTVQTNLQNLPTAQKNAYYASLNGAASPFDLRLKRSISDFKATWSATKSLDVDIAFRNTLKNGNQPWGGTFGFSDAVELAVPIKTSTNDLGLGLEWANSRGSTRVGYDGSFFRNELTTLVWDNPLRITDSPTLGPLQGRESLWPDSNMNTGSLSGLLNLPARSRATAYISVGNWSQDDPLIPYTVNSALPSIPLDRQTSNAQARITSMNYTFNSRPVDNLWLTARFRSYDYDNRTPIFHVANTVAYDTTVSAFADGGTSPYSINRKTFDAEASYTPYRYSAFRVGYTREQIDQTFRTFDTTTEDIVRVSADASGISWLMLRAVYEHGNRSGSGLDEQSLDDIGEQTSLRQFDISDRRSNRFSLVAQVTPVSSFSINGTASAGNEDRGATVFGLRSNDNRAYQVGFDYVPNKTVSLGASYQWERYTSLQASRQANPGPQFDDPTRDWTTHGDDKASTFNASLDLLKVLRKTDIRLAYDLSHAESLYLYGLAPNSTLAAPVQLPAVVNELQRATVDVRYHFSRHFGGGIVYWFDKYAVNDFAMDAGTLTTIAQPSFLMIGYVYRPYTAHTFSGRFTYYW